MDLNTSNMLVLLTFFGALRIAFHAFKIGLTMSRGWLAVAGLCMLLGGIGLLYFPARAGYLCGPVFIVFCLMPSMASRYLARLTYQGNYGRARWITRIMACLHPADGIPSQVKIADAIHSAMNGDLTAVDRLLDKHAKVDHPVSCVGVLQLLRMKNKWADILELCEKEPVQRMMRDVPSFPVYRLRALFETGRLHEALQYYLHLRKHGPPRVYRVLQILGTDIFLFAFTGRVHSLQKLLDKKRIGSTPMGRYWLTTAKWVSGDASAMEDFRKMADAEDAIMRHAAERQLKNPPASTPPLTDAENELLDAVDCELNHACRYGHRTAKGKKAFVTFGIAGLIILMFAVELSGGGARNLLHLWHLGALDADKVCEGQYWRLIAALFLHFGWLHVTFNLFALLYFGPFVEASLGHLRFSICYFLTGMGSMLLLVLFIQLEWLQPMIVMGASGSIMGLIGATGAILFHGWRVDAAAFARRRFMDIGLLIILQTLFDIITPEVSFTAHISGVVLGFIITLVLQANLGVRKTGQRVECEQ